MEFKKGNGWRCCYDPETGRYTAETGGGPNHDLYEITKEIEIFREAFAIKRSGL